MPAMVSCMGAPVARRKNRIADWLLHDDGMQISVYSAVYLGYHFMSCLMALLVAVIHDGERFCGEFSSQE